MIPKEITIGAFTFKVELVREIIHNDSRLEGTAVDGYVFYDRGIIQILNSLGKMTEQTFWHEVIHCIDKVYNADALTDECTVDRISQGVYQAVKCLYPEDWK